MCYLYETTISTVVFYVVLCLRKKIAFQYIFDDFNIYVGFADDAEVISLCLQSMAEADAVRLLTLNLGHKPYLSAMQSKVGCEIPWSQTLLQCHAKQGRL